MARYTDSVCKLCRREGEKLFLKGERCFTPKCAYERRPYAPGQHGKTALFYACQNFWMENFNRFHLRAENVPGRCMFRRQE